VHAAGRQRTSASPIFCAMARMGVLRQNLAIARGFTPMSP
jgi:hypothetical protein